MVIPSNLPDFTQNLLTKLTHLGLSEAQIYGFFAYLGLRPFSAKQKDEGTFILKILHDLLPYDQATPLEEFAGPMRPFTPLYEELMTKFDMDFVIRDIEIEGVEPFNLHTPQDHDLFQNCPPMIEKMADVNSFLMDFFSVSGERLIEDGIPFEHAILCGNYQMSCVLQTDVKLAHQLALALNLKSPVFSEICKFIFSEQQNYLFGYLDTQLALAGLWGGLDEHFIKLAWPFQSWVFFKDGDVVEGVEQLGHKDFYELCWSQAHKLKDEYSENIPKLSDTNLEQFYLPRERSFGDAEKYIEQVWGCQNKPNNSAIQNLEFRACLLHFVVASLCLEKDFVN